MSLKAYRENKMLAKISGFTVTLPWTAVSGNLTMDALKVNITSWNFQNAFGSDLALTKEVASFFIQQ